MECILVIGMPGCGKTTLIEKYRKENSKIEFINLGREVKHDYTSEQSNNIYKKFLLRVKDKAQKGEIDKVIIEGFPANVMQVDNFIKRLSKYFDATCVIDMHYSDDDHAKIFNASNSDIKNKILYYVVQGKLAICMMDTKARAENLPIICKSLQVKPNDKKNNYNKFKNAIKEFDILVTEAKQQIENDQQSRLELDLSDPDTLVNFLISLYQNLNTPNTNYLLKCLQKYKNRQKGE